MASSGLANDGNVGMNAPNYYNQNIAQERYIPLSIILDSAIQRTYRQLMIMIDMFPEVQDENKKIKIVAFACKTRQLFTRIYALIKFFRTAHINVSNILTFLDQQSFFFVDTADFLFHLAKGKLVNARLPSYSILTAVDVLSLGTYPKLPTCIKDRILPIEKISNEDKESTLLNLNRIIQCRLALSELPSQLKNFEIKKGYVKFLVKNEFEIKLTLMSDNFRMPWRLLKLNFLVKDSQDPNRSLVHKRQTNYVHEILQYRLNENERPLVDIYRSLHFFAQSLQLEIFFQQMNILNRLTFGKFYKISEYSNWKKLTVKYWLEYSKNQYDFKFSIIVGENSDYLQTSHYPPLFWRDHKNIDLMFKTDELLIEKIVHQIIKFRSIKRLIEVQTTFKKIKYCTPILVEEKPALNIKFFLSKYQYESLWIMIDFYSGLFQVVIPHSSTNSNFKQSIENCMNSDLKKLETVLLEFRMWLVLKRCEMLAQSYGYKCSDELFLVSFLNDDLSQVYSKLDKNRLYIELKKQEKVFIMITISSNKSLLDSDNKEEINWHDNPEILENENNLRLNYYILNLAKCRYDGEVDPTKPFLKLMSINEFKKSLILKEGKQLVHRPNKELNDIFHNDILILEFINMIFYIEERFPFLNFLSVLNKQNVVTQNITMNPKMIPLISLNLISPPSLTNTDVVEYKNIEKLSKELWGLLLSFTIRHKQFKDYLNIAMPIISFIKIPSILSKFIFTLEFTFRYGITMNEAYGDINLSEINESHEILTDKKIDVFSTTIEANNLEAIYNLMKLEWISMCKMFHLIKEVKYAFSTYSELKKHIRIKSLNLKKICLKYGPNFAYTVQFSWSKENKFYDIILGIDKLYGSKPQVDSPFLNYHIFFINEIKKFFQETPSVINLVQILNYTCLPTFSLAKLANLPKFYSKSSTQTIAPYPGFMLIIRSLTHFRLTYYSRYCIDIQIKPNGLVSIRDGSFCLTDINATIEELHPIQFLASFLNLFIDENVEELLRKPMPMYQDDSQSSPKQQQNQQHLQPPLQQQQHVFLPPTSPAVQARINSNLPAASPSIHSFVQSPGISGGPTSNTPSIAQSPGFTNFGSPAIPHSSPTTSSQQMQLTNQQHSASVQSPSSFMSPATNSQQQNFSIQSPANFSELSMPSPSVSIRSPFVSQSHLNLGPKDDEQIKSVKSVNSQMIQSNFPNSTQMTQQQLLKKYNSTSTPIYLTEQGFLRFLAVDPDTGYSPFEIFLVTNHLKKILLKTIQYDQNSFQVKNLDTNFYKTHYIEFQIQTEITNTNYNAFSLSITQSNELQVDLLTRYFNNKILCPPYKSIPLTAFFNVLYISELKFLKEILQLLEIEMNPTNFKSLWRLRFCWTIPTGYVSKNPKFSQIIQASPMGFQKKDRHYILINLMNQQRLPNSLGFIYLLIGYDSLNNNIQHEILRPLNDNNLIYNAYESYITNIILSKQKDPNNFSLLNVIYDILIQMPPSAGNPPIK